MDALLLILRYGFLALLYLFLWQALRAVGRDVAAVPPGGTPHRRDRTLAAATSRETADQAEEPALVVEAGEKVLNRPVGERIPIGPGLTLGRQQDADLAIASKFASARHADIRPSERGFLIEDLGSTNGTIVNGRIIREPQVLRDGDHILIGEAAFIFRTTKP